MLCHSEYINKEMRASARTGNDFKNRFWEEEKKTDGTKSVLSLEPRGTQVSEALRGAALVELLNGSGLMGKLEKVAHEHEDEMQQAR